MWLAPEVLAGKSWTSGSNPNVVADSRGDAFAAWAHRPEFNGDSVIETSIKPGGSSTWQAPVRLSSGGENSEWPILAVDAAGDVTAVWEGRNGTESDIEAAVRPAGSGTWTAPVQLATDTGKYGGPPELAVDPEGDAVVVWAHENGAGSDVIEATSKPHGGETWQVPVSVSAGGDLAGSPNVAMDANGDAFVAWDQSSGSDYVVDAAGRPATTGVWQTPEVLSPPGENAYGPSVAMFPQGDAVATWEVQAESYPPKSQITSRGAEHHDTKRPERS